MYTWAPRPPEAGLKIESVSRGAGEGQLTIR